ncbi:unnamed protein product [Trifolium pratense]|uniref:Uncharacterized protein n=1 Tax=Trifolium pratense TaxID=57577 RepID=A0ACB0K6V4_TRIPR|nr:unnamed protein product [Trifolium pratense]
MAGPSSSSSTKIPPFMFRHLQIVGNEMEFPESQLTLLPEKMVDFDSLKENGYDVKPYFSAQGWNKYFDMLNGPIYPDLLKKFWMKARVFSKYEAKQEELAAIERNPSLKGKTRKEMGLLEFTGTQIRSNICGINLTFSPIHFNALLGLDNSGLVLDDFEKDTRFREELLHRMCIDMKLKGKVKGLTDECRVLFKIILSTISPRVGGTDTISWPHRHLIYFLLTERKVNLGKYFFERICEAIFQSKSQRKTTIVYPRLLSDLLYQGHIVQNLKKFYPELMAQKLLPEVLNASFLTKMHLINTKLVQPKQEFRVRPEDRLYVEGYPVISEADAEHVIQDYLEVLRQEGLVVDRSMVPPAPVNMYKPKRKPKRKADSQDEQVKPDLLAQKKVKVEQSMAEQRTKRKHEETANKAAEGASKKPIVIEEDSSSEESESEDETESDEETIAESLRRRPAPISKDKGKSSKYVFNENEIGIGYTKPLRTILPTSDIPTSDNPLSELEKHLSPDPLNNHPPSHETQHKSSSPPKPTSPQPDIPSSEPQPDIPPATEIPTLSTIPNPSPSSSNTFRNLSTQFHEDLLRLSTIKDRFLVCPSDVDLEVSSIKARICNALDVAAAKVKAVIGKRDLEGISFMRDSLARAELKRLTPFNHEEHERAKLVAIAAAVRRMSEFKDCWVDSTLLQRLEDQRTENERLEEAAARVAELANELQNEDATEEDVLDVLASQNQEDVLMIDYPEEGEPSDKGKAPLVEEPEPVIEDQAPVMADQLQIFQEALREQQEGLERQRAAQETLETKVDGLVSNVGSLNDKFDQLLAFLKKP